MAFVKKTWLARLGQGLNKFILNGGSRVTLESSPDTVTQQGTPLSAENMNDLEDRIDSEFTNVNSAINAINNTMFDKNRLRHADFTLTTNTYGTLILFNATGWSTFFDSNKDIIVSILPTSQFVDEIYTLGWNSEGYPWVKVTDYTFAPLVNVSREVRVYTIRVL